MSSKDFFSKRFAYFIRQSQTAFYLDFLVVGTEFKRQGVGKSLVYSIFDLFTEVQEISLDTRVFNNESKQFYPALGFTSAPSKKPNYLFYHLNKDDRVLD